MFLRFRKDNTGASKMKGAKEPILSEKQRRRLSLYIVGLLLLVAIVLIALPRGAGGLSACEGIILTAQKDACISALASSTDNLSICSYLAQQGSQNCVLNIAVQQGNISTCSLLESTPQAHYACVSNISFADKNPAYCALLSGSQRDDCAYGLAKLVNFTESAACTQISNSSIMRICLSLYYYKNALDHRNQSSCGMLLNNANGSLLTDIIDESGGNQSLSSIFDYASENITPRDYCYNQLAIEERNQSVCSFNAGAAQTICQEAVSAEERLNTTNNQLNCTKLSLEGGNLTNSSVKGNATANLTRYFSKINLFACTLTESFRERNITLCKTLANSTQYNSCVWDFIKTLNATNDCGYLTNATLQSYCASGYA
jgi:hypothetical protein